MVVILVRRYLTIDNAKKALDAVEAVEKVVMHHVTRDENEQIQALLEDIAELELKRDTLLSEMYDNKREVARTTGRYGEQVTSEISGVYNAVHSQRVERINHEIQAKHDELRRLQF